VNTPSKYVHQSYCFRVRVKTNESQKKEGPIALQEERMRA
jgi:hypothetical protein